MFTKIPVKIIFACAASLVIGLAGGFFISQYVVLGQGIALGEAQNQLLKADSIGTLSRVWQTLNDKFVEKGKISAQKAIYGAANGMIKSLGDPYSGFFDPSQTKILSQDIGGSFEGVGMEIGFRNGALTVVAPLEGTPAETAGIRAGDRILKINGEATGDLSLEEAVSKIRGKRGTVVTLNIFRESWDEAKDIEITRGVITLVSVRVKELEGGVVYIKLNNFFEMSSVAEAKSALSRPGSSAIVLDLRNNPGGLLYKSIEIAGWFLKPGTPVVAQDYGNGTNKRVENTNGPGTFEQFPIVILVNKGTASAAEILAGALRDNRGTLLIGEKTFGKGSVQELIQYPDGSSVKITVAHWLTPKGTRLQDKGLEPDISVSDDSTQKGDPVLEAGLEALRGAAR